MFNQEKIASIINVIADECTRININNRDDIETFIERVDEELTNLCMVLDEHKK